LIGRSPGAVLVLMPKHGSDLTTAPSSFAVGGPVLVHRMTRKTTAQPSQHGAGARRERYNIDAAGPATPGQSAGKQPAGFSVTDAVAGQRAGLPERLDGAAGGADPPLCRAPPRRATAGRSAP
jgi:hypothetical protein